MPAAATRKRRAADSATARPYSRGVTPQPATPDRPRPLPRVKICLESRYRKLVRGLPQTIHYCPICKGHKRKRKNCGNCQGFGKISKDSVQELIGRTLLPAFKAREGKFHGAGREDVDVRMLGAGRPFVYEVVGAKILEPDLEALLARIHDQHGDRIRLDPFVRVPRERIAYWKEARFDKTYAADVELEEDADPAAVEALVGRELDISQRTPQRVVHRRADVARERRVRLLAARLEAPRRLRIEVLCEHGTYVKEWISGDGGRTEPSLAGVLGIAGVCAALDVLEVLTDSPAG